MSAGCACSPVRVCGSREIWQTSGEENSRRPPSPAGSQFSVVEKRIRNLFKPWFQFEVFPVRAAVVHRSQSQTKESADRGDACTAATKARSSNRKTQGKSLFRVDGTGILQTLRVIV